MTEERKYQEMLQRIRGFRLLDDDFMTKCFEENIEATELVLRIVLNKPDIKVVKVQTQYSMKNIKGRSLRLDIYATDSENKPIYHIDRYIREVEEYFDDGSHIIYVNASYKDDTELGKLMHDFSVIEPEDMNFKVLANATSYYKKDKEGIQAMCKAMEDMITDDRKETALRLLKQGVLSNEQIAEGVGLDIEVVNALAEENSLQTV